MNTSTTSSSACEDLRHKLRYPLRVSGIQADVIGEFRKRSDHELKKHNVVRLIADEKPGFPCRVSLADAEIGESLLLLNFEHLPVSSPYRSIGAIFVRESATETYSRTNEIPEVLRVFAETRVAYIHVHYARPGSFACRIDRA